MAIEAKIISLNVDDRVDFAVKVSMDIYMNKLASGFIEAGLENTFQMSLASILQNELDQHTYYDNERFMVKFEKNMPINDNRDYIDIVVEYKRGQETMLYPIELKFKKVSDGAPAVGNIESYKDIYNLDSHKYNPSSVFGCYFIFLTNNKAYLTAGSGTRAEIPMHDGYTIRANHNYRVTGNAALKSTSEKYPAGFTFNSNYHIEYQHMYMPNVNTTEKDYWFFIIKM